MCRVQTVNDHIITDKLAQTSLEGYAKIISTQALKKGPFILKYIEFFIKKKMPLKIYSWSLIVSGVYLYVIQNRYNIEGDSIELSNNGEFRFFERGKYMQNMNF